MRNKFSISLSIAATALALTLPVIAQSGAVQSPPATSPGHREASRMVPANVALQKPLDASKVAAGAEFRTILSAKVKLDNGPELPRGTLLLGNIVTDDMNVGGTSKLALRFTQAVLKDGTKVPIKATIIGAFEPEPIGDDGNTSIPGQQASNNWDDSTVQVDQIDVMKGVDLHSKISSKNSGVFVSSTDKDVQLPAGSELALAIAQAKPEA